MSLYLYYFLLIELAVVSWGDMREGKIPNAWSLLNLGIFFTLAIFWPSQYDMFSLATFLYPLIFFLIGFVLFSLDIMGGGDSKFLATFFLLLPGDGQGIFLEALLWVTIVVASSLLLYHSVRNRGQLWSVLITRNWRGLQKIYGKKFPFAPTILFAWPIFGHIMGVWR